MSEIMVNHHDTRMNRHDLLAIVVLVLLWLLFFWRLFTPVTADQASLKQGDFSGQFVTFAGYQYQRLSHGEIPLWDPYNNGGMPFIADTQAAVFYPPRLLTIGLSSLSGGWTYHALELEMTFHVLAFTLMMYVFVRRLTGSVFGAFIAAIIAGYGGYLSGYPPLQLALLEAGIWLPLAALGILEATRGEKIRWLWLGVTGFALGLSWMAGHSQTSYFLTYLLLAYCGYRVWTMPSTGIRIRRVQNLRVQRLIAFILGVGVFGLITFGLAAVQFLPSAEYLLRTTRAGLGYDAKSNGFPLQDVLQFFIPGVVSQWSPLWIGITGLTLAMVALWRRLTQAKFWGAVALLALLWSFGGNSVVYPLLYNLLPGLSFFRGQERAAYLVVDSLAILSGMGAAWLMQWEAMRDQVAGLRLRLTLNRAFYLALAFGALVFVSWIGNPDAFGKVIHPVALTLIVTGAIYLIVSLALARNPRRLLWALAALLVFELFSFNMDSPFDYDHIPPAQQIPISTPPFLARTVAPSNDPYHVDGSRGLTDNFGSLYNVMDIHGISPLFLAGMHNLIETDLPDRVKWTLLGVRYVYTDWQELAVPSKIVATGTDRYGAVNLHQLETPRPFAAILYRTAVVGSDDQAYALLHDANYDYRRIAILDRDTGINNSAAPDETPASVVEFASESIMINASAPYDGVLTLAMPQYPGWYATIDGQPAEIMRAYGALAAIQLKQGDHLVRLVYNPLSYRVGASLSLFTWIGIVILGIIAFVRTFRAKDSTQKREDQLKAAK
jgi:predicted small integral membrane protein